MRPNTRFVPCLSARLGIAIVGALAAVVTCDARDASQSPETGRPTCLINTPDCATGDAFDEWPFCVGIKGPSVR
jgi:hypothetical protein